MGDIGNVDSKLPVSVIKFLQRNCVVEIPCRLGVNCNDGRVGEICSISDGFIEFFGLAPSFFENGLWELFGKIVLSNNTERINSWRAAIPEDFSNDTFARLIDGWEVCNFDDDFVIGFAVFCSSVTNKDSRLEDASIDIHEAHVSRDTVGPDETMSVSLYNFYDLPTNTRA